MARKVAFLFPGQGSQHPDMLAGFPMSGELDGLLTLAEELSGQDLRGALVDGSPEVLADTAVAQPLLYLTDWMWAETLMARGLQPAVVAGHSLGELAALAIAGVYPVDAGLKLVVRRSQLMAACVAETPGAMSAVIGMESAMIKEAIESVHDAWTANDNSSGQVVISGTKDGIATATSALLDAGARKVVALDVAGGFHSPLMQGAAAGFSALLDEVVFQDAQVPVISNVDPTPSRQGAELKSRLAEQMVSPVRWTETMDALIAEGIDIAVECGPGGVLTGLGRRVQGIQVVSAEMLGVDGVLAEVER